jgi:hypothetical protein
MWSSKTEKLMACVIASATSLLTGCRVQCTSKGLSDLSFIIDSKRVIVAFRVLLASI